MDGKGYNNMVKIILILALSSIIVLANKTYTLTQNEYLKYKQNPKEMEQVFIDKYVYKKVKKATVKKIVTNKKLKMVVIPNKVKNTKVVKKEYKLENIKVTKVKEKKLVLKKQIKKIASPVIKPKIKVVKKAKNIPSIKVKKVAIIKPKIRKNKVKNNYKKVTKINDNFAFKSIDKVKQFYTFKEVNNKLKYDKITQNKNIKLLKSSINELLKDSKHSYEIKDILSVIDQIHNKKLSTFESEVYLKQITQLIGDIN